MKEIELIDNINEVLAKNPEHTEKLAPVLEYLEEIVRGKESSSMKIFYFGTDGKSGHCPKCIKGRMSEDEYSCLNRADSDSFEKLVCVDSDGYITGIRVGEGKFSVFGIPYSVDDSRAGSHTYLFMEGCHTKREMEDYIKNDDFLKRQFGYGCKGD